MSVTIDRVFAIREKIEQLSSSMDDKEIIKYPELLPSWDGNERNYVTGDRVRYKNSVFKCTEDHISSVHQPPEHGLEDIATISPENTIDVNNINIKTSSINMLEQNLIKDVNSIDVDSSQIFWEKL